MPTLYEDGTMQIFDGGSDSVVPEIALVSLYNSIGCVFLSDSVQVLLLLQENSSYQRMLTSKILISA